MGMRFRLRAATPPRLRGGAVSGSVSVADRKEAPSATAGPAGPPRRVRKPVAYADRSWNRWKKDRPPRDPRHFRAATDPPSNWREGPRRSFVDYGKPYDEEFPGMDPGELDAAICDDACFPGDLGFGSRVTGDRFS